MVPCLHLDICIILSPWVPFKVLFSMADHEATEKHDNGQVAAEHAM